MTAASRSTGRMHAGALATSRTLGPVLRVLAEHWATGITTLALSEQAHVLNAHSDAAGLRANGCGVHVAYECRSATDRKVYRYWLTHASDAAMRFLGVRGCLSCGKARDAEDRILCATCCLGRGELVKAMEMVERRSRRCYVAPPEKVATTAATSTARPPQRWRDLQGEQMRLPS